MNPVTVDPAAGLGFAHFLGQADAVGKTLLLILIVMSVLSWALILIKGLTQMVRRRRSDAFLNFFWNARSLEEVGAEINAHGVKDPFGHLTAHAMHAQAHHANCSIGSHATHNLTVALGGGFGGLGGKCLDLKMMID